MVRDGIVDPDPNLGEVPAQVVPQRPQANVLDRSPKMARNLTLVAISASKYNWDWRRRGRCKPRRSSPSNPTPFLRGLGHHPHPARRPCRDQHRPHPGRAEPALPRPRLLRRCLDRAEHRDQHRQQLAKQHGGDLRRLTPGASPQGQLRQLALVLQTFLHLPTRQEWQQFLVVALDPVRAVADGPLVALAGDDL